MTRLDAGEVARTAGAAARQAGDSRWLARLARVGLAARGLVYVLVAVLALELVFGAHSTEPDQQGAFQTLAQHAAGKAVLWAAVAGFLGYAVWQITEAGWGYRTERRAGRRTAQRIESAGKAAVYIALAVLAIRVLTSGGSHSSGETATAKLLGMTGGRYLVGLGGLVIAAIGAVLAWRGLRTKFAEELRLGQLRPAARSAVVALGKVGYVARGVVYAIVGGLVVAAAVTFDPAKARGLDAALRTLAAQPAGQWLLTATAIGLICFGAYSFADARYHRL